MPQTVITPKTIGKAHSSSAMSPHTVRDLARILGINAVLLRQLNRRRSFTFWSHLTPKERLTSLAIVTGGGVLLVSSVAWAVAVSYMTHQRVRMVKLAGIADEKVAQLATVQDIAATNRDAAIAARSTTNGLEVH
jgi:type II secretory pathway component PulM